MSSTILLRVALLVALGVGMAMPAEPAARPPAPAAVPAAAPADRPETGALPEYQPAPPPLERSLFGDTLRMLLSLAAVLALVGAGVHVLRRWPTLGVRGAGSGPLQVIGRLPLGTKESVCLIRAGGELLVLGVSPAGIALLGTLPEGATGGLRSAQIGGGPAVSGGTGFVPGVRLRGLAARVREVQGLFRLGGPEAGRPR
jgi:flagellar biosynthetic protein FliO